jgi:superkiller protein 3
LKLGRTRDGIREYEAAFSAGQRTPGIIDTILKDYQETRQTDKLLDFYSQLTSLFPGNPAFHHNLGLMLAQAGRLPEAIEQYQQAIEIYPQNAEAFNNLGAAYYAQKDFPHAGGCYERALQIDPDYVKAHYNLAGLFYLYRADALPDAIAHLEAAVRLKPDYAEARFLLAKCYRVAHRNQRAIAAGKKALETARSKKQAGLAAEIEKWLGSVRAGQL